MAVNNSLAKSDKKEEKKVPFSVQINSKGYQMMINHTLKDKKTADLFVASIISAVSATPGLNDCEAKSIVSAALLGEALKLSPSPQLGQYYLVPFKDKKNEVTNAQFVLGYKGYIQLAIRSGQYKRLNAMEIKKGELISYNPFDDEITLEYCDDEQLRDSLPTIGYYAMFEQHNGFRKIIYWSKEKMLIHADRYSPAFSLDGTSGQYGKVSYADYEAGNYNKKDERKYSNFWYKDFDGMACKTMLRQLISKWGVMSVDMQKAYESDGGVIGENGEVNFSDTQISENNAANDNIVDIEPASDVAETEDEQPVQKSFADIMEG